MQAVEHKQLKVKAHSEPLYFCRGFKNKVGLSPKLYCEKVMKRHVGLEPYQPKSFVITGYDGS
ncbi:hypothetical protein BCT63_09610 [Vibrio kanaloae]|nr:hypothetical protein BCT63_09610 [Vibrio kanaloae]